MCLSVSVSKPSLLFCLPPSSSRMEDEFATVTEYNISHVFDLHHLMHISECFQDEHGEASRVLNLTEFTALVKRVIGTKCLTDIQIQRIFERIDANGDSNIDWNEWLNFFMIFDQNRANLRQDLQHTQLALQPTENVNPLHFHSKIITKIIPLKPLKAYVTGSCDGLVKLWQASTLAHLQTLTTVPETHHQPFGKAQRSVWVVDLCYMQQMNLLVVALSNTNLLFYQIGGWEAPYHRMEELIHHPTCLHACSWDNRYVLCSNELV